MFGRMINIKKTKRPKFEFEKAEDVEKLAHDIVQKIPMAHVKLDSLYFVRSQGSKARAYARIWGLSRIFQVAAGYKPTYVIEVISKYFDKLPNEEKMKVLIHELLHIPKTFSGALKAHRGRHHRVDRREVEKWYKQLKIS